MNIGMSFLKQATHMDCIQGLHAKPSEKHLDRSIGIMGCNLCLMMGVRQQGMLEVRS